MKFAIQPHSGINKSFQITTGDELILYVDYDDVNHAEVDAQAEQAVKILNEHWTDPPVTTLFGYPVELCIKPLDGEEIRVKHFLKLDDPFRPLLDTEPILEAINQAEMDGKL